MKKMTLTAFALAAAFSAPVFAQSSQSEAASNSDATATSAMPATQASDTAANNSTAKHSNALKADTQKTIPKKVYKKPVKHYHHYYHHHHFYGDHPMGWDGTGVPKYIPPGDNPKWYDHSTPGFLKGYHYHHKGYIHHKEYSTNTPQDPVSKHYKHYRQGADVKYRYYDPHCQCYKFSKWDRQRAWEHYNKHWNGVWVQGKDGEWYDSRKLDRKDWKQPQYLSQPTQPTMSPALSAPEKTEPQYYPPLPAHYDPKVYKGS